MSELEDITEEELENIFEKKDYFFWKVFTKLPLILKTITDLFSKFGEIDYEQSYSKETRDEFIVYIAYETEQGFNNSKAQKTSILTEL